MKKNYGVYLLGLILLSMTGCRDSGTAQRTYADATGAITGILIDDELAQLLSQVVPYNADGENALPEEKRFLFNLNKLINEDLAGQSDKYKLAACKLALRQALAINKTVDSIEVRRYATRVKEPYGDYSGIHGIDVKGNFQWILGGDIEDRAQWDDTNNHYGASTNDLFTLKEGKITNVKVYALVDTCGGRFSGCCGGAADPPGLNDAWFQNFVDLGRQEDFPIASSEYSPKIVEYMAEKGMEPVEKLSLQGPRITNEYLANLVMLKDLKHLSIDLTNAKDADAKREAFFELFPKLPQLHTINMKSGPVTEAQMQKLAECQNLTHLVVSNFSAATPKVFAPINRMKKLEILSIASETSGAYWDYHSSLWYVPFRLENDALELDKNKPSQETIEICDLPNLTHVYLVGTTQGCPLSLTNLPNLEQLITDAPKVEGDIFTERTPKNLKVLSCAGLGVTKEQMQHIGALVQLEKLELYRLYPENLDVFSPLEDAKNLKHLGLVFTGLQQLPNVRYNYNNMTLTIPSVELSSLRIRYPYSSSYLKVKIPNMAKNYWMNVENVHFIDEIPPFPDQFYCRESKMSYAQFQAFKQGDAHEKDSYRYSNWSFESFTLTDIDEDDLFVDFVFPYELKIWFDREMAEALKGKTLHFENSDRLSSLNLSGINFAETNIRLTGLTKMRDCQIRQ